MEEREKEKTKQEMERERERSVKRPFCRGSRKEKRKRGRETTIQI